MFDSIFRRKDEEEKFKELGRMPPGQSLTNRFPVLHYGPVPRLTPRPGISAFGVKLNNRCASPGMSLASCPGQKLPWTSTV